MAITYHAGRRIQGLSTDTVQTITLDEDFSSNNFTYSGSSITYDSTNKRQNFTMPNSLTADYSYYNLGSALSNSAWVLRFKFVTTTWDLATGNSIKNSWIGLFDNTSDFATSQSGIFFNFGSMDFTGVNHVRYMNANDVYATTPNTDSAGYGGSPLTTSATAGTYYVKLVRDGNTGYCYVYSDNLFSNLQYSKSFTIDSNMPNLQYLKHGSRVGTATGTVSGYIDDIEIFDGVTSVTSKPTNVQSGSRFEETDTRKIYYGALPSPTYEDDFSGADNWTDSGSILGVNTGTDVIDFESATSNNVKEQTTYDLTSTSDTKWVLRCKLNVTTFTQPTVEYHRFFVGLSSSTSNLNTAEDAIGLKYELGASSFNQLVAIDTDGTTIRATTGDNFTHTSAVETLYVEIIRQSATTYDVYLRSGSHSGSLVESKTGLTVSASTNSLRYIKIASYSDNAGNGELSGTVDDIQFYNGVTSTDFTWTEEV